MFPRYSVRIVMYVKVRKSHAIVLPVAKVYLIFDVRQQTLLVIRFRIASTTESLAAYLFSFCSYF